MPSPSERRRRLELAAVLVSSAVAALFSLLALILHLRGVL